MELFLSALYTLRTSDCTRSRLRLIALHMYIINSSTTKCVVYETWLSSLLFLVDTMFNNDLVWEFLVYPLILELKDDLVKVACLPVDTLVEEQSDLVEEISKRFSPASIVRRMQITLYGGDESVQLKLSAAPAALRVERAIIVNRQRKVDNRVKCHKPFRLHLNSPGCEHNIWPVWYQWIQ